MQVWGFVGRSEGKMRKARGWLVEGRMEVG